MTNWPAYPPTLNRDSAQAQGLLRWWPAGAAQGNFLRDFGPHAKHGASVGTITIANDSSMRRTFATDGAASYYAPNAPVYSTTAPYSIALWVATPGAAVADRRLYTEGSTSSASPFFALGSSTSNNLLLRVQVRDDTNANKLLLDSTTQVFATANTWRHIVWTDYAGAGALYVNGVLDATNFAYTPAATTLNTSAIGCLLRSSAALFFAGKFADVRIYNRKLSAADAWSLYAPSTRWNLYWRPNRRYFVPQVAAAPTFQTAWARGSNTLLGGGIH